jgi:photosystem II stability/assembly factor-like uncharacterized protein
LLVVLMRVVLLILAAWPLWAQWSLQESHSAASLRGVAAISGRVAWASGTEGTVLRTVDGGTNWQHCAIPAGAERLDFRGVQAVDGMTAVVMASGPGDESRLYKTADGCRSWKLVLQNQDAPGGFFDAIQLSGRSGYVVGDPVRGRFAVFETRDAGDTWRKAESLPVADEGEALFAASNSSLLAWDGRGFFVTGGTRSRVVWMDGRAPVELPLRHGVASQGAFSVARRPGLGGAADVLVVVGGDYQHREQSVSTCAVSRDGGGHWMAARRSPGGYRSAVAFEAVLKRWIVVGPNGTDVSYDDGLDWNAIGTAADGSEKNWNALSLPFAVGPKGRIGRLR